MSGACILTIRSRAGDILDQRARNALGRPLTLSDALTMVGNISGVYGATDFDIVDAGDGDRWVTGSTYSRGVQELHPTVVPHPAACASPAAVKRLERATGMAAVVRNGIGRFMRGVATPRRAASGEAGER